MNLRLKIINLDGVYFEDEVKLLNIKTSNGELSILANHIPLISAVEISHMYVIDTNENKINFAIAGGTLFVSDSECKVITTAIEKENEIDKDRATKAKLRAEARLANKDADIDLRRAEIALRRSINRLSDF